MRFQFLDPMRRDYRGIEHHPGTDALIVGGDEEDIMHCDIVLANAVRPSWGTGMEIRAAAKEYGKKVVTICTDENPSPWLTRHSWWVCRSLVDAICSVRDIATTLNKDLVTVYLCGGINGLSDAECSDWREAAKAALDCAYVEEK